MYQDRDRLPGVKERLITIEHLQTIISKGLYFCSVKNKYINAKVNYSSCMLFVPAFPCIQNGTVSNSFLICCCHYTKENTQGAPAEKFVSGVSTSLTTFTTQTGASISA